MSLLTKPMIGLSSLQIDADKDWRGQLLREEQDEVFDSC